jgi:hypothetical protein
MSCFRGSRPFDELLTVFKYSAVSESATVPSGVEIEKKRKSIGGAGAGELKKKRESIAGGADEKALVAADVVLVGDSATAVFASSVLAGNALYESNCARLAALGVPGPPTFLQPLWPGFMTDLSIRSKVGVTVCQQFSLVSVC